jgi:hypothetical protein
LPRSFLGLDFCTTGSMSRFTSWPATCNG